MPRSMTSRCSSARENRDTGSPCVAGSSQASAFTSATCSGGKTTRAARALPILQAGQPLLEEPLPPATDHLRRRLQPPRDLGVALTLGRVQDHLRPHHHLVRQRVAGNPTLELSPLLATQLDHEPARPGHNTTIRHREPGPFKRLPTELPDGRTSAPNRCLRGRDASRSRPVARAGRAPG